jgi:hypothetical protein
MVEPGAATGDDCSARFALATDTIDGLDGEAITTGFRAVFSL